MAIRFDNDADYLRIPHTLDPFTILGWFKLTTGSGWSTIFAHDDDLGIEGSGPPSYEADGTLLGLYVQGHWGTVNISVGVWAFGGFSRNGNDWEVYTAPTATSGFTFGSHTEVIDEPAFLVGTNAYAESMDGVVGPFYVYDTALTEAEFEHQRSQILPIKDPWSWVPGIYTGSQRAEDQSGNGRDWAENGTLTDEAGPPVSWGGRPIVIIGQALGDPIYTQTKFRIYNDDGIGLGEPA
jgi:hypothetical protein